MQLLEPVEGCAVVCEVIFERFQEADEYDSALVFYLVAHNVAEAKVISFVKESAKVMKKEELLVREASRNDIAVIQAFQLAMAEETEGLVLDVDTLMKGISAVFDAPEKGKYFVAVLDETIVGSLMITYEWSDWRCRTIYWIQSVYVLPDYRRKGVYRALYEYVRTLAEADETVGGIRLYVDSQNHAAQHTYSRLGMNGEHYRVFEWMRTF